MGLKLSSNHGLKVTIAANKVAHPQQLHHFTVLIDRASRIHRDEISLVMDNQIQVVQVQEVQVSGGDAGVTVIDHIRILVLDRGETSRTLLRVVITLRDTCEASKNW